MYIINFIRGFFMALADSVPGVSGGTVAFILGFYDKFITSLDDLATGSMEKKKEALKFLFKIGIGWIVGFVLAVLVLGNLFESHIYQISSLFIGFIIFAIPIIIKEEKDCLKGKYLNLIFFIIGIAVVCAITYFNPIGSAETSIDVSHVSLKLGIYTFLVAMIAISEMVLPGISGSTLLLIFGLYMPIINAIKEFLHFNLSYMPILIIFGLGIITGILLTIKIIKKSIENHRSAMMYLILGLMIGSIYAIIEGPKTLDIPQAALSFKTFSIIYFIIGGLVIIGMQLLKNKLEKGKQD